MTNQLLSSLPHESREWLQLLEPVKLRSGMVLYEPDEDIQHVYFLNNALVSIISMNSEGSTVEIGLIGNEGMVGVPVILGGVAPYRAIVQMGGDAFRIGSRRLYEEFRKNPFVRDLLLKYTNAFLIQIAQSKYLQLLSHTSGAPLQVAACRSGRGSVGRALSDA